MHGIAGWEDRNFLGGLRRFSVDLHPGLVLIAVVGTLFTLGALIALVIVPLLGSVIVILRYIRARQAGRDPWPELTLEQSGGEGESGA